MVVADLRQEQRFSGPPLLVEHGVISGMSYIIRGTDGTPWGVLGAHSTRRLTWTQDDVNFLAAVANILGDAIARERAEAALREREEHIRRLNTYLQADLARMTRLQQVSTRLVQTHDVAALLDEILDAALAITDADMGNIQLLDGDTLKIVAHRGFEAPFLDFFNTVHEGLAACGTALQRGERILVEDVTTSPLFVSSPAYDVMLAAQARAVQSTPLITRAGRMLGMFSTHYRTPHRPTPGEIHLLDILARQAADAIERAQAEAALRESEERFRVMADNLPLIVWLHDAAGRQEFVNHTFCEYFGVSRAEMREDRWRMLTHPADGTAYADAFLACVRARRPFHAEVRARRADGQWRWLESWGRPRFGPGGEFLGHVGTSADVTERKQAEEALRQQREWFEVTLASIGDGVITTDTMGCITFMNPVAEALTAWPAQEALGRPIAQVLWLLHESTRQPMPSPVARVLQEGHIVHLANHTVLCTRDGREVVITDSGAPIRSTNGELLGVVMVFQDVSAQHQMEAELFRARKIESVGVLAGGIAHDFNNLLTGILGNISFAKLLVSGDAKAVARLMEAEKDCQRGDRPHPPVAHLRQRGAACPPDYHARAPPHRIRHLCLAGGQGPWDLSHRRRPLACGRGYRANEPGLPERGA